MRMFLARLSKIGPIALAKDPCGRRKSRCFNCQKGPCGECHVTLFPAGDYRPVLWSCAALGRLDLPMTENEKPEQFGDVVFLVHGVGSAEPGALVQEARPVLQPFSIQPLDVHEYNWHQIVGYPLGSKSWLQSSITVSYLTAIMAGFRGAVQSSVSQTRSRLSRLTLQILALASDALVLCWCVAPIFLIEGALAKTADRIPSALKWTLIGSVWVNVIIIFAGIAFVTGVSVPAWFRRALLIIIRPYILITYAPFLLPLGRVSMELAAIITSGVLFVALALPLWHVHISLVDVVRMASSLAGIVLGFGFVSTFLLVYLLSPLLKIVSDIFRYAGDADYREEIQSRMVEKVRAIGSLRDRRVFLVGHSLGSVIALNSLLRSDSPWSEAKQIVLVTMGSPLERLFHRFFPEWCADPGSMATYLTGQKKIVRWINVYRPFDPVGTRLTSIRTPASSILDCSTRQWHRLLLWAHTGYWSDPLVAQTVSVALSMVKTPTFEKSDRIDPEVADPLFYRMPRRAATNLGVAFLPLLAVPLGVVWLFLSVRSLAPTDTLQRRNEIQKALSESSKTAKGFVLYSHPSRGSDYWRVEFVWEGTGSTVTEPLTDANANMAELMHEVGFGTSHRKEIKVLYSPHASRDYFLADYLPSTQQIRPSGVGAFFGALWFGLSGVALLGVPCFALWWLYLGAQDLKTPATQGYQHGKLR